jgi:hypothetical protein
VPVYELGQTLTFGLKTYDAAGAPADVGNLPSATLTKPDGTTAVGNVTKTTTGTYTALATATALGRWSCVWSGSGVNSGGLPYTDVADVLDMSRLIISLGDARAALNIPAAITVNDDELRGYCAAATVVVEDLIGPVLPATQVERRSGSGRYALPLFQYPSAVTSVIEDGVTLTASDYALDEAGVLWRGSHMGAGTWSSNGVRNVVVTYTVGAATIPPNVLNAARELVKFWYSSSQQGTRPQLQPDAPAYPMVAGFAVPNAVADKLAPSDNRVPGLA